MMNKKAFTLIEMLIVIVLMGVIMTIAIPSVMKIVENKSNDQYKIQLKLVEQATNLYQVRYRGEFNNSPDASCYLLDYQLLLNEDLIDEQDINCSGKIVLTKNAKKNLTKKYFLNCKDKNNVEFSHYNESEIPGGCVVLGEDTETGVISITPPTITGGNNDWVSTDVDITVENSGISLSDVDYYDYYVSKSNTKPSKYVEKTGTTSNKVTITENGTSYIWFRVVDKSGNVSNWSNRQIVNIDKEIPTEPIITSSDNISSGNIHQNNFILTFGGGDNISGNSYYYGTDQNATEMSTAIEVTPEYNGKRIYVKSCSGANICSNIKSYLVNIAVNEPSS